MTGGPIPEPAGDIRAQLAAVMDDQHPKRACFLVPQNACQIPLVPGAYVEARPEGTLVTRDGALADQFWDAPSETDAFDRVMAEILGYPEHKALVAARCDGDPARNAFAVQARDAEGYVVTEAYASAQGLVETFDAMKAHAPPGGGVWIMTPIESISRRIMLRLAEQQA